MQKFKMNGGKVLQKKVESLQQFCGQNYDAVINCTGVQAHNLVGDKLVQPVRGQVLRVSQYFKFISLVILQSDRNLEHHHVSVLCVTL